MTPFTLLPQTRSKRRVGRILGSLFVGFCVLAIMLNLVLPHGSSAASDPVILNPDADASVKQSNSTQTFPSSNQLLVAGGHHAHQSFLRFTLNGIPDGATIQSAKLRLVATRGSANGGIISSLRVHK